MELVRRSHAGVTLLLPVVCATERLATNECVQKAAEWGFFYDPNEETCDMYGFCANTIGAILPDERLRINSLKVKYTTENS